MWEEYFYTESNTNGRFDLLVYYISEDYFEVFLNARCKDYASGGLNNTYLKRCDFDLKIKELTKNAYTMLGWLTPQIMTTTDF